MTERVFNLFVYISDPAEIIHEIGVVCHDLDGTDAEKLAHLQAAVDADYPEAKRYPVPSRYMLHDGTTDQPQPGRITHATFATKINPSEFFEEVFADHDAGPDPLMCVTCIIDGKPVIDKQSPI